MSFTRFMDMHSGGGLKEKYQYIYIEAPEQEAKLIFYNRFGHNPERVTCTCCGQDYSISESEDLYQATAYERNCEYGYFNAAGIEVTQDEAWIRGEGMIAGCTSKYVERQREDRWGGRPYMSLEDYLKNPGILVIRAEDIKDEERIGELPEQGYVWQD